MFLYLWPHSLHQLIIHGRLHPDIVVEGLWVFDSELFLQSVVMSIQPPSLLYQPWTRLIYFGFSRPLSFPSLLHIFQSRQQSAASSIIHVVQKMLDSTTFYSRSGSSPIILLIHFWHFAKYIWSMFEIFDLHFVWILRRSNRIRQPFCLHSGYIRTTFEAPSNWRYWNSNRTAIV